MANKNFIDNFFIISSDVRFTFTNTNCDNADKQLNTIIQLHLCTYTSYEKNVDELFSENFGIPIPVSNANIWIHCGLSAHSTFVGCRFKSREGLKYFLWTINLTDVVHLDHW